MNQIRQLANEIIEEFCMECVEKRLQEEIEKQQNDDRHQAFFENLFIYLAPHEEELKSILNRIWKDQERQVVANLKKLKRSLLEQRKKDEVDDLLYPSQQYVKRIAKESKAFYIKVMTEEGQRIADHHNFEIEKAFEAPNHDELMEWLATYIPKFSENLEEVNIELLREELMEGIAAGEGIPQLIKRVNNTYNRFYTYRSEMIARTETVRASNKAAIAVYRASGVVEKKVWITHFDDRVCPLCESLDGKVVELDTSYFDLGDEVEIDGQKFKFDYEVVEAPPAHTLCRCAIAPAID